MLYKKGFTIIELMIAISIFSVLFILIVSMFQSVFENPKQYLVSMDNIDLARVIVSNFTNELRNATNGSDGSYPLNLAGNSEIIFYSNFGSAGNAAKRIRYYVSGDVLYKGVVVPSGVPLFYNLSSETVSTVFKGIKNSGAPLFYYYNGDYDGLGASLTQPVNVNQVKFIKINLILPNQITSKDTSSFSISAGATIRALKNNLGN